MAAPTSVDQGREALSCRGVARTYGLGRAFVAELIRSGELPAVRRGRALLVLRSDVEAWWRRQATHPGADREHVDSVVRDWLEREARTGV